MNIRSGEKEVRRFCLLLAVVCALLAALLWWRGGSGFPALAAAFLCAGGLFFPRPFGVLYRAWMMLALVLGWVMTRVVLAAFFFLVVTPIGLIIRLTRKDPLDLKWGGNRDSYWVRREGGRRGGHRHENQF